MPALATKLSPGILALALSGCVVGESVMQETTRSLARTAVNGAANQYLPGVNVSPYTDCVINNAQTGELVQLAQYASAGTNGAGQAWPVVRTIATRPEATQCLVQSLSTTDLLKVGGVSL
ncbi:succinate dehydrogenase [Xinfangfangia sp. D13-10-4-6]|uniref:succinate dehydrogenase n=1 Tax=Pseudogemmobacter hezensis TaxID=2737662 RepID=UPI0015561BC3|nr:succinate dehydrogenase [Pseudogemmobacter hezensis]NPD14063.1 succinate dehydrogenase [Pseudogemmobacter hezensis]